MLKVINMRQFVAERPERRLVRTLQIAGFKDALGRDQSYKIIYNGLHSDGTIKADVLLRRANGSYMLLQPHKDQEEIRWALLRARHAGIEAEYCLANSII